jgi:hypothetical protein
MDRNSMGVMIASALILIFSYPGLSNERSCLYDFPSMPPQIAEFYEDYNFVASFSTSAEREMLIENFTREVLPKDIRSARFNRVFRMMKRLFSRVMRFDPEMEVYRGPRKAYIKYFFNSELLEARKVERSDKKAVVEVLTYSVEPEFINRFISQFNENAGEEDKIPSNEDRVKTVKSRIIPKVEFHIWYFQDGTWMRAEHKNIYIKQ